MKPWLLFTTFLLAAGYAMAGQNHFPASAAQLSQEIEAKGAKAVVDSLGDAFDDVLDHIDSGDPAWIALAPKLAQGTDAGNSEGLAIALAYALPKNPQAVLAVVTENDGVLAINRVCSIPFIEDTVKDRPAYKRNALHAVEAIKEPSLRKAKSNCLAVLSGSS